MARAAHLEVMKVYRQFMHDYFSLSSIPLDLTT
jgi:hypothetical protein